jgi:hypothetical protein
VTTTTKRTPARRPDGVKRPQDHKPPETEVKPVVEKVDGGRKVTHKGVTVTIPDEALDDFELLDDLREMEQTGNVSVLPSLLRRLAGPDGYKAVMEGLRNPDTGRVSAGDGAEYVQAIFEALGNS